MFTVTGEKQGQNGIDADTYIYIYRHRDKGLSQLAV